MGVDVTHEVIITDEMVGDCVDPTWLTRQLARDPAREGVWEHKDRAAKLKMREGIRMFLTGFEDLHHLPRSVETKKEQGRR